MTKMFLKKKLLLALILANVWYQPAKIHADNDGIKIAVAAVVGFISYVDFVSV